MHDDLFEGTDNEGQREHLPNGVEVFRITGPLFFGIASDLIDTLKAMGQMPKVLILRMRLVPYLDATGAEAIEKVIQQCQQKGTSIILCGIQSQPLRILNNAHIVSGEGGVYYSPDYKTSLQMAVDLLK
jgi:SulP family sulfate permease